jgi:tetratricopeptide (TPR) repeat protein
VVGEPGSREIGRQLQVRTLLEGSVRKAGDRLRISVQLTDAESGFQLWSTRLDGEGADIFAMEDEIAQSVAGALRVRLSPAEKAAMERTPAPDARAYDLYLRGRKFYYEYSPRAMEFALQLFSRAIELAGDYAQALASRGLSFSVSGKAEEAEEAFEEAIRLDPELFEAWYFYARHSFARGEAEKAIGLYEGAMRVRPDDFQSRLLVAQSYDDTGRADEGRVTRRLGVDLAARHLELNPDDARALYNGGVVRGGFAGNQPHHDAVWGNASDSGGDDRRRSAAGGQRARHRRAVVRTGGEPVHTAEGLQPQPDGRKRAVPLEGGAGTGEQEHGPHDHRVGAVGRSTSGLSGLGDDG